MDRKRAVFLYFALLLTITALDLWTKGLIFDRLNVRLEPTGDGLSRIAARDPQIELVEGKLAFEAAINPGAFNGMFAGVRWLLVAVSVAWVMGTLGFVVFHASTPVLLLVALGLTAGGALGNLWDRLQYGVVRDFVKVYHGDWVWPNFNLADSAICTGVGLILLREFLLARQRKKSAGEAPATPPESAAEGTP